MIPTFQDLTAHLADYLGGNGEKDARDYRRSARDAMKDVAQSFDWTHYLTRTTLNVLAPYSGVAAFDLTGGTVEREVTLLGGGWPLWAADGTLTIGGLRCEVERRIDAATLTLSARTCPADDVALGEVTLEQDAYPAPADFLKPASGLVSREGRCSGPGYVESGRLFARGDCGSWPGEYTIAGDPNYQNGTAFFFRPAPREDASYEYLYRRFPRPLTVEAESSGSVAVTGGSASVAGTGTAFSQKHVGCVLRLGSGASAPEDEDAADVERVVLAVASATSLTADAPFEKTASGRGYVLSDPLDVAPYMLVYLKRQAEYRLDEFRVRQGYRTGSAKDAQEAFRAAAASDNRSAGPRWVGRDDGFPVGPLFTSGRSVW